jgi:hypothetical protein
MHLPSFDRRCKFYYYYNTRKNLNFVIIAFDYVILCFAIYAFWCGFFMSKVLKIGFFFYKVKTFYFYSFCFWSRT